MVTRWSGHSSTPVAALGIAAGVTQAIGLSRWVYAVPNLAATWTASAADTGVGVIGGLVLLLGLVEGLAPVISFDPGVFGLAGLVGVLVLTIWLIWTGILCILRPTTSSGS